MGPAWRASAPSARFGCAAIAAAAFAFAAVLAVATSISDEWPTVARAPFEWTVILLTVFVLYRVLRRALSFRYTPACPHCGVATDVRYRVCRSCGRVKRSHSAS